MMALYLILVSVAYGVLWLLEPRLADAIVGYVVFLVLVPAVVGEASWWRGRRDA